jgi:transposase, IS5 family
MQRQGSFAEAEYAGKKKQTRCDRFLAEMEQAVPWARLLERLGPFIRRADAAGLRSRWNACCGSILCSSGTG